VTGVVRISEAALRQEAGTAFINSLRGADLGYSMHFLAKLQFAGIIGMAKNSRFLAG
jgi:hypothetical protein